MGGTTRVGLPTMASASIEIGTSRRGTALVLWTGERPAPGTRSQTSLTEHSWAGDRHIEFVGVAVGNITNHEAATSSETGHVDPLNRVHIMDRAGLPGEAWRRPLVGPRTTPTSLRATPGRWRLPDRGHA